MSLGHTQIKIPRSKFPKFVYDTDEIPPHGWVIQGFRNVYKDGKLAGLFIQLGVDSEGKSGLTLEWIGEPLSSRELIE